MNGTLLVALGAAVFCLIGWLESRSHQRNLAKIPVRIHINGTRGKSGVARLIAAGLRAGGMRTFAKTTGTLARAIFPDASEYPIFRPGRTNVIEQVRMIRLAAEQKVDALVIECMALHPSLQSLCELKFVKSTHGVITNARADHLDVMGPTADDVAKAIASTVPVKGKLFTAERKYLPTFREATVDRGSSLVAVGVDDVSEVTRDELEQFSYVAHAENVALALRVCAEFGIDRQTALAGMWAAQPDPGSMTVARLNHGRQRIAFVNGFAANDPESTGHIWNMMLDRHENYQTRIAVINCRHDRRHRSVQLAEAIPGWQPADHFILLGTGTDLFRRVAIEQGLDELAMVSMEDATAEEIAQEVYRRAGESAIVMGMGNTAGPGMRLADHFEQLATRPKRPAVQPAIRPSTQPATQPAMQQAGLTGTYQSTPSQASGLLAKATFRLQEVA